MQTHEHPTAAELFAVEVEFKLAVFQAGVRVADGRPRAAVPYDHLAGTVLAVGDLTLKLGVFNWMVLDFDRQTLLAGVERRAFGDCPAF